SGAACSIACSCSSSPARPPARRRSRCRSWSRSSSRAYGSWSPRRRGHGVCRPGTPDIRGYPHRMRQVSTAVAAARDAIRRHPWWSDSLLALALTVIAVGSTVISRTRYGYDAPVLAAIVTLFTTLPLALRRYRPLEVLAITVIAETALLIF